MSDDKKEIISFDPFSSSEDNKDDKKKEEEKSDEHIRIIYITGAIIFGLIILYILILIFTREPSVDVLEEMLNIDSQKDLVDDKKEL